MQRITGLAVLVAAALAAGCGAPSFKLFTVTVEVGVRPTVEVEATGRVYTSVAWMSVIHDDNAEDRKPDQAITVDRPGEISAGTYADNAQSGPVNHSHNAFGLGVPMSGRAESAITFSIDRAGSATVLSFAGTARANGTAQITGTVDIPDGDEVGAWGGIYAGAQGAALFVMRIYEPMDYTFSGSPGITAQLSGPAPDTTLTGSGSGRLESPHIGWILEVFVRTLDEGHASVQFNSTQDTGNVVSDSFTSEQSGTFTFTLTPASPAANAGAPAPDRVSGSR